MALSFFGYTLFDLYIFFNSLIYYFYLSKLVFFYALFSNYLKFRLLDFNKLVILLGYFKDLIG